MNNLTIFYSLGFSVLLLNYRGSSGYGQDSVDSTAGNVGSADVQDCQQAAEYLVNQCGFKNVVLFGGSHGGFLTCHLIGQYPGFYKAAVGLNSVTCLECENFFIFTYCRGIVNSP